MPRKYGSYDEFMDGLDAEGFGDDDPDEIDVGALDEEDLVFLAPPKLPVKAIPIAKPKTRKKTLK